MAIPLLSHAQHYAAYMYKNDHPGIPVTQFSPTDTIGVRVILKDLPPGLHTLHTDWYNAAGKLQDTNRYRFEKQTDRIEAIDTQLEIIKASPLRRLFSVSEATGYHMAFYGRWQVKFSLDGEEIIRKDFEVK